MSEKSKKKNLNKVLIWAFLWTALWWLGLFSKTKKWKSFFSKIKNDIKLGLSEMKKTFQSLISKDDKEK